MTYHPQHHTASPVPEKHLNLNATSVGRMLAGKSTLERAKYLKAAIDMCSPDERHDTISALLILMEQPDA